MRYSGGEFLLRETLMTYDKKRLIWILIVIFFFFANMILLAVAWLGGYLGK